MSFFKLKSCRVFKKLCNEPRTVQYIVKFLLSVEMINTRAESLKLYRDILRTTKLITGTNNQG
jgi:hypothetical protein